jgi:hypothetical protein
VQTDDQVAPRGPDTPRVTNPLVEPAEQVTVKAVIGNGDLAAPAYEVPDRIVSR